MEASSLSQGSTGVHPLERLLYKTPEIEGGGTILQKKIVKGTRASPFMPRLATGLRSTNILHFWWLTLISRITDRNGI